MRRRLIAAAAVVIALLVLAAGALSFWGWSELNKPLDMPEEGVLFNVASGSTLTRVANELHALDLVQRPFVMNLYARLSGAATQIKVGEYRFESGISVIDLIDKLITGDVVQHQFTIIEGWKFSEILVALRAHPAISATSLSAPEVMAELGRGGVHPEGQLMPDTYSFTRSTPDIEVLRRAHAAMQDALTNIWAERGELTVLQTPYDALILASIIEKETALADERARISGVFNRRLQRGIRLQTDPTVIYGLGDDFDGDLRRRDLQTDTPYNTYTRAGLPPTPIALPGYAALEAAVNPADDSALYFVATGLGDGSHYFSSSLEEHNDAVSRYLRQLRSADP